MADCICLNRSPEDYDGPLEDCPVHGVKACLIQAQSDLAGANTMIGSLRAELARAQQATAEARLLIGALGVRLESYAHHWHTPHPGGLGLCDDMACSVSATLIDEAREALDVPAASEATP